MGVDVYIGSATIPNAPPPEMPLISRGLPATSTALVDSSYQTQESGTPTHDFAINLSSVDPSQRTNCALVWWNQTRPTIGNPGPWYGTPSAYTIDQNSSTSGTKPTSGWSNILTVTSNTDSGRAHLGLDLSSANWVRLSATATNGNGLNLQIDIHDTRLGALDIIGFAGDSNCMQAYNGERLDGLEYNGGSLENLLEAATGRPCPIIINYGVGGEIASHYRSTYLPTVIAGPAHYIHYNIGTNDANNAGAVLNDSQLDAIVADALGALHDIQAAGKVAIWGTIPYGFAKASHTTNVVNLNAKMSAAVAADPSIRIGADSYAISNADHSLIGSDGLHYTYDPTAQYVTSSSPTGYPDGLVGYEVLLRETVAKLKANVYGM
jgi:hypothetical protein